MTSDLKAKGKKMASVEHVAQEIVNAIAAGKLHIYTPRFWRIVMLIVSHIPWFIFKKLNL
jgi:short-subunit dehydrogenase